jgi:hypothetical protein
MNHRSVAAVLLCSALAACTGPDDEGTYHLTLTLNTETSSPLDTLPSKLSWPSETELTLHFENANTVRLEIFGGEVTTDADRLKYSPRDPDIADGTLFLAFGTQFRVTVEDTVACPQTHAPSLHGSTVLYIWNGHVRGSTTDDEACSVEGDIPYARFFFDITGDRIEIDE